jgi:hypothetical protein
MSEFKKYLRRVTHGELRPYAPGEDVSRIRDGASAEPGDLIGRNVANHDDLYVVKRANFPGIFHTEPVGPA